MNRGEEEIDTDTEWDEFDETSEVITDIDNDNDDDDDDNDNDDNDLQGNNDDVLTMEEWLAWAEPLRPEQP